MGPSPHLYFLQQVAWDKQCDRGVQENGISPGGEEGATLLQDHGLASLCAELFFDLLYHSVHLWGQICQTQAKQTVIGISDRSCS